MTPEIPATAEAQAALLLPRAARHAALRGQDGGGEDGGHAMGDIALGKAFARDIALLKQCHVNPIVADGGGPQIGAMPSKMGIESKFEGGWRVTDQKTVEIVEMVVGLISKEIVALINAEGRAIGLCGKDGNMAFAEKAKKTVTIYFKIERVLDLGFVGEPVEVDRTLLDLGAGNDSGDRRRLRQAATATYNHADICRRHCGRAQRHAPVVPDGCSRRTDPRQEPDRRTDGQPGQEADQ